MNITMPEYVAAKRAEICAMINCELYIVKDAGCGELLSAMRVDDKVALFRSSGITWSRVSSAVERYEVVRRYVEGETLSITV